MRTQRIEDIEVTLARPYDVDAKWFGGELALRQLQAAWYRFGDEDAPMNPRLVGRPGVGKTTLAVHVARSMKQEVYLMQATSDTRPEDLIITPVLKEGQNLSYVASPIVSAMLVGGICILDEGNRMSEKSWASLAPLLDHRRYLDSITTGLRIQAHKDFRFVSTMNDDASVFDLPEYIQSRLCPQIFLDFADPLTESKIIKESLPYLDEEILAYLVAFLQRAHIGGQSWSVREALQIGQYAMRLMKVESGLQATDAIKQSVLAVLGEDGLLWIPESPNDDGPFKPLRPI